MSLGDRGKELDAFLRIRGKSNPIYVFISDKVDLYSAFGCVMASCAGDRIPELSGWLTRHQLEDCEIANEKRLRRPLNVRRVS